MNTPTQAPVLFISHGAPTLALEPGLLGPQLKRLGQQLQGVRAVLVVSPHWQTRGVKVMTTALPETVHDFGGFPARLYELRYPASGQPELAQEAARLLEASSFSTGLDESRGLDHGAWVPLYHLLPEANVPVFQVSMPFDLSTQSAFQLGRALAPLREKGVLIMASGSMTHNLHELRPSASPPQTYAQEFAHWVKVAVLANAVQPLIQYRTEAPHAQRAHPTEEHFLPLLVALGAQGSGDTPQWINGGVTHGVLSMDSYVWGMPALATGLSTQTASATI
jgi:4,5-DOPA dioxygenase extradiol